MVWFCKSHSFILSESELKHVPCEQRFLSLNWKLWREKNLSLQGMKHATQHTLLFYASEYLTFLVFLIVIQVFLLRTLKNLCFKSELQILWGFQSPKLKPGFWNLYRNTVTRIRNYILYSNSIINTAFVTFVFVLKPPSTPPII